MNKPNSAKWRSAYHMGFEVGCFHYLIDKKELDGDSWTVNQLIERFGPRAIYWAELGHRVGYRMMRCTLLSLSDHSNRRRKQPREWKR